jgi:hypothetical protein
MVKFAAPAGTQNLSFAVPTDPAKGKEFALHRTLFTLTPEDDETCDRLIFGIDKRGAMSDFLDAY